MDIKSQILQRVSSEPLQVEKEFLSQEPEFLERKKINNLESMLFEMKGHQPIEAVSLSFEKIKNWADENNILVQESLESPHFLIFIK